MAEQNKGLVLVEKGDPLSTAGGACHPTQIDRLLPLEAWVCVRLSRQNHRHHLLVLCRTLRLQTQTDRTRREHLNLGNIVRDDLFETRRECIEHFQMEYGGLTRSNGISNTV